MLTFRHRYRDGSSVEILGDLDRLDFRGSGMVKPQIPGRYIEWVIWRQHVNTSIQRLLCRKISSSLKTG